MYYRKHLGEMELDPPKLQQVKLTQLNLRGKNETGQIKLIRSICKTDPLIPRIYRPLN